MLEYQLSLHYPHKPCSLITPQSALVGSKAATKNPLQNSRQERYTTVMRMKSPKEMRIYIEQGILGG